jgi:hypothetical protein
MSPQPNLGKPRKRPVKKRTSQDLANNAADNITLSTAAKRMTLADMDTATDRWRHQRLREHLETPDETTDGF